MRQLALALCAFLLAIPVAAASDVYLKVNTSGQELAEDLVALEIELGIGRHALDLHGAAIVINQSSGTVNAVPMTGSCVFQNDGTLFCSVDYRITRTLNFSIGFDLRQTQAGVQFSRFEFEFEIFSPNGQREGYGVGTLERADF